jgi:hypothetical protein
MAEIEKICDEKKTSTGLEYLIRWKGFDSSHDEWMKEKDIQGLGSLLQYYKERNKRVTEAKQMREHKEEASKPPPAYKPNRRAVVGDVVAIYPSKKEKDLIMMGKVLSVSKTKYNVQWWSSKKLDGTWSEEYLKPKKGSKARHGGPYAGSIWREAVIDVLPNLHGLKRGKIKNNQLKKITKLAKEYKKR